MKDYQTLYQHGTLGMLVPGLFEGTLPVSDLLKHGNTGIGTATGLDGEMVVLDGVSYLVKSSGQIIHLAGDVKVPFATVHYHDPKLAGFTLENKTDAQVKETILQKYPYQNIFFAVNIKGTFAHVKTRAVQGQKKPYPTLVEVAEKQAVFAEADSQGTIVGYFAPKLFQGMAAAGFHLHYLNDDRTMGGHLLGFTIKKAEVSIQPFTNVNKHFPLENTTFLHENLDLDSMSAQIHQAEE